ncbi:hypothetical protein [Clostridium sp.]|uniref:hypothetical protein n=1 Tax=Clostridium sp. TaxID=1506 RepID=UPI00321745D2
MKNFLSVEGIVTCIEIMKTTTDDESGCTMLMSVRGKSDDNFNLVVSINTYFVDHVNIRPGDNIIAFYDAFAPVPLIFPPQFRAIVIAVKSKKQNVEVDHFNRKLINSDGMLKLNISHKTQILLQNNQTFLGNIENRNLVVVYGSSTKSIPAMTTPSKIIVLCDNFCNM